MENSEGIENIESNEINNENNKEDSVKKDEIMLPKHRLQEVEAKRDKVVAELMELKALQESKEAGDPEDKPYGLDENESRKAELKALNDETVRIGKELEAKTAKETALLEAIDKIVEAKIETIPEDLRDIVPDLDSVSLIQWLAKAEAKGLFTVEYEEDTSRESIGRRTNGGSSSASTIDINGDQ